MACLFSIKQEVNSVYNILAGILNIGNLDFIEKEDQHLPIVTIENPKLTNIGKLS